MSIPERLYLNYDNDELLTKVFLGKNASDALFEYLLPHLERINPQEADAFEGEYLGNVLSLTSWPAHQFMEVYQLIMQACDTVEILKPCKEDLKQALEADKRYQAV